MLAIALLSRVGDGAATQGCAGYVKVSQPLSLEHLGVVAV
jgi:hypothetical protein